MKTTMGAMLLMSTFVSQAMAGDQCQQEDDCLEMAGKKELTVEQRIDAGFNRMVAAGRIEEEWTDFLPKQKAYKLYSAINGKKAKSPFSIAIIGAKTTTAMTGVGTSTVQVADPFKPNFGDSYSYKKKNIMNNTDSRTIKFGVDILPNLTLYALYGSSDTYVDSNLYGHQDTGNVPASFLEGAGYSESQSDNHGFGFTYSTAFSTDWFLSADANVLISDTQVDSQSNDLKYPNMPYKKAMYQATGENYTGNGSVIVGRKFMNDDLNVYSGLNYRNMNQNLSVVKPDGIHQSAQTNENKWNIVFGAKYTFIGETSIFASASFGQGHDDLEGDDYSQYDTTQAYSSSYAVGLETRF
ncbi:MAG: hypothetical protein HRU20_32525 [Pseudomonadales bacterium]|nr:hypothetical protein [Pseudomonadales bacterium]